MIPLAMALAAVLLQPQAGWPLPNRPLRRSLTITNRSDLAMPAGTTVKIRIASRLLGLDEGELPSPETCAMAHGGAPTPCGIRPDDGEGLAAILFKVGSALEPGRSDAGYFIYYGGAQRPGPGASPPPFHDFFEDFSRTSTPLHFGADLSGTIQGEALRIERMSANAAEHRPARIVLPVLPPAEAFSLSVEMRVARRDQDELFAGLRIDLHEEAAPPEADLRQVADLVEQLGAVDWQERETATLGLIRIGRAAVPAVEGAASSDDPEVKWRAEHVLERLRLEFPPRRIQATCRFSEVNDLRSFTIGRSTGVSAYPKSRDPIVLRIERDPDGEILILWNGKRTVTADLPGKVRELSLIAGGRGHDGAPWISFDSIALGPFIGPDAQPAAVAGDEERK